MCLMSTVHAYVQYVSLERVLFMSKRKTIRFQDSTMEALADVQKMLKKDPTFAKVGDQNFTWLVNSLLTDYVSILKSWKRKGFDYADSVRSMKAASDLPSSGSNFKKIDSEIERNRQILTMLMYLAMDTNEISRLPNRQGTLEKMGTFADPQSPAGKKYKVLADLLSKNKF